MLNAFPLRAREAPSCLPEAEFDAAFSEQVRGGQQAIVTSRFAGRNLCSGKSFAQRLQELRRQFFPHEEEARQRSLARRAAIDRAKREAYEARLALEQARADRLASLDYEADVAEAHLRKAEAEQHLAEARHRAAVAKRRIAEEEWLEALARSRKAQAELSQAEAERQLASLPPLVRDGAIRIEPANTISSREEREALAGIDAFLRHESKNWPTGLTYQPNSVNDLSVLGKSSKAPYLIVVAHFRYGDGSDGWVEIHNDGDQFTESRFFLQNGDEIEESWLDWGLGFISDVGYEVLTSAVSGLLVRIVTKGKVRI